MQFRKLTANQELVLPTLVNTLLPGLLARGINLEEASALAQNTVLLYFVLVMEPQPQLPEDLLHLLSLEEIADVCEQYLELDENSCHEKVQ